jgi:riboflavin-specific deaminase-like protein
MDLSASDLSSDSSEVWAALRAGEPCAADADPVATAMFGLYGPIARPEKTPFVIGQMGQSLDGFIATTTGASHYINGPESLVHLHRLRALCDTVIVGWRTVEADDPQLTVRSAAGENPLRVVIDIEGRLPAAHRAFEDSSGALRLTGAGVASLEGVTSAAVPTTGTRADPKAVIDLLARRGCKRILIEGGGALVSNFLCAGLLDRLHLSVAPLILGDGRRGIVLPPAASLETALRPASRQYHMGTDVLFDLDLRV